MRKVPRQNTPQTVPLVGADNVENRLISLSMIEAERRILAHTASDAVLIHFMKIGSTINELQVERLRGETELMAARRNSIRQQGSSSEDYLNVINAILGYRRSGFDDEELP